MKVTDLLVKLGCDISKETLSGQTAAIIAHTYQHSTIRTRLEFVDLLKTKAREGEWHRLKEAILETKFSVPPIQWVLDTPIQARNELSSWVQSSMVDSQACYSALQRPLSTSRSPPIPEIRLKVAHDGHKHILKLIASYLVYSQPASRQFFLDANQILTDLNSTNENSDSLCVLQ